MLGSRVAQARLRRDPWEHGVELVPPDSLRCDRDADPSEAGLLCKVEQPDDGAVAKTTTPAADGAARAFGGPGPTRPPRERATL